MSEFKIQEKRIQRSEGRLVLFVYPDGIGRPIFEDGCLDASRIPYNPKFHKKVGEVANLVVTRIINAHQVTTPELQEKNAA